MSILYRFNEIKERGYEGRIVDALAETSDEGRSWVRKASGSYQTNCDPEMSEWGNPLTFIVSTYN